MAIGPPAAGRSSHETEPAHPGVHPGAPPLLLTVARVKREMWVPREQLQRESACGFGCPKNILRKRLCKLKLAKVPTVLRMPPGVLMSGGGGYYNVASLRRAPLAPWAELQQTPVTDRTARRATQTLNAGGGDPREDMRHVGGGWSTPQREILRWGWGGLDPPARDLALGGAGGDPPARARGSAPRARWALAWFSDTSPL